ncbi:UNKNOWN [Stylonychia lemnae]|uniref:Uncharacterized protein n=1 Tax=Stylonychia lemnae TaxID=5949 RepID=A0A078AE91_STYLE|nr:UNKNOWN [Stylonychia lemnae]|eukprot:CDW79238.1 UNKNOWN [Stylonychia lemnae]
MRTKEHLQNSSNLALQIYSYLETRNNTQGTEESIDRNYHSNQQENIQLNANLDLQQEESKKDMINPLDYENEEDAESECRIMIQQSSDKSIDKKAQTQANLKPKSLINSPKNQAKSQHDDLREKQTNLDQSHSAISIKIQRPSDYDPSFLNPVPDYLRASSQKLQEMPLQESELIYRSNSTAHNNFGSQNQDPNCSLNESSHTIQNLKLLKSEDTEKLLKMDKIDIIKYYEGLLDKCHEREKDALQQQYAAKETLLKQYQSAFEDLKCKNYQLENVAFTYHMTVQRLKEKELTLSQRNEDLHEQSIRVEAALRAKHEEAYQIQREKDSLTYDLRRQQEIEDQLRMELDQMQVMRDVAEKDVDDMKKKLSKLDIDMMRLQGENQRLKRDSSTYRSNNRSTNLNASTHQTIVRFDQEEDDDTIVYESINNKIDQGVSWVSQPKSTQVFNNSSFRKSLPEPSINMGYEHSFSTKPNVKQSYQEDFYQKIKRRDISNEHNPFQRPQTNSSFSPVRVNNNEDYEQKSQNTRKGAANNTIDHSSYNKIDESTYMKNKRKQESSQLQGVFNWGSNDQSSFNLRNVAEDYRKSYQPTSATTQGNKSNYQNSPYKQTFGDQDVNDFSDQQGIYSTPQKSNRRGKSCSYMGIGERDNEDFSSATKGSKGQDRSAVVNEFKKNGSNQQTLQVMSQKLNQELTQLQLEKQRLEGEYGKVRGSSTSARNNMKYKKEILENEIDQVDSRISKIRLNIRDLKSQGLII